MDSCSTLAPLEPVSSWEEDRKFVLRAWCLVFIVLATMMLLSVLDGRMAYLYGSYTGYVGFWTNCRKHMCADLHQVTVLIHMSMGFMILAMILSLVLLFAMGFSFRPALRRLNKTDLVFSTLGSFTGLLILLSLTLFIANCEMLQPRPHVSYLVTTYLSWGAGALMLWAGILSYLNYMGMWGKGTPSMERRMSYRRWASLQSTRKSISEPPSDAGSKHTEDLSV
ncbi:transmembrane protein 202-like isoform X4 [Odocoileus virginianus]|uniref:Transmembrane protein 202-like isoform X4 n=1 Tax=Odocoileus virginianus TaxID=9874 RepID=A0A6J0XD86_ODOVR|nr:transmembrane protein 202-like isoform X4 [Odocoileus virginianus texanus]